VRIGITKDGLQRLARGARLRGVALPGASRLQLEQTLTAAYASGLLSEHTLAERIDLLLGSRLIDPAYLIGDLGYRDLRRRALAVRLRAAARRIGRLIGRRQPEPLLLGLEWDGGSRELSIGRHHSCDIRLTNPRVSRRHARLVFRDGVWIVHDLGSTNGTVVNGVTIGRCRIHPGDELAFGGERVRVD
jgi:FHA domain